MIRKPPKTQRALEKFESFNPTTQRVISTFTNNPHTFGNNKITAENQRLLSTLEKLQLGALAFCLERSVGINSLARETSAESGSKTENRDRLRLLQREPCPERRDGTEKRLQALAAPKTETGAANCETSSAAESNRHGRGFH
jgi:hypothetical protein